MVQCPNLGNKILKYNEYILLFEEFDLGVKEIYNSEMLEKEKYKQSVEVSNKKPSRINENKQNNLIVRDLFELFQGPVQLNGSIIMATTNNFE
ncbi:hypothetical protein Catovirus_1_565 [Catovirus CTV1]|uniref:Uncharacterized protein n=1 Tax=Catovirus CTV1 TaxID=1977631 RepID=A0A1V0S9X3_9VIRU|nr:hypothetical protein Catovirus_1_565 [Catovirus CTV1]